MSAADRTAKLRDLLWDIHDAVAYLEAGELRARARAQRVATEVAAPQGGPT